MRASVPYEGVRLFFHFAGEYVKPGERPCRLEDQPVHNFAKCLKCFPPFEKGRGKTFETRHETGKERDV